ncbi:sulfatase-like hydrolase/transferase [Novosphingobium aquae]|uniref:Sulfatase-like hydrolase/transferase n=1 Tax=Novosphingobium aquae TaxID=3133435 RepID=A0ABU8SBG0_9SPHN
MARARKQGRAIALGFLAFASTGALAGTAPERDRPKPAAERPNIVFILSDDHAWQAISAYRQGIASTPAIDRIGREGVVLDRMLSPNSLCAPARAMLLTGKYSHRNGVRDNYDTFNGSQPTLQGLLHKAGYRTALFGKWHLKSTPQGFDDWEILSDLQGQGRYWNPTFERATGTIQRQGYASRLITERTLEWLRARPRDDKPFLLFMWHKGPHRPFDPDVVARGAPGPVPAAPPAMTPGRGALPELVSQRMEVGRDLNPRDLKLRYPAASNSRQRAAWDRRYATANQQYRTNRPLGANQAAWNYGRYITDYRDAAQSVDDSVGTLLAELDRQNLSSNTIVIYSSDQGFFLGERGLFDKRWYFDESLRTPFLMRWPGHIAGGQRAEGLASQVDVLPTLLQAAGAAPQAGLDGISFLPALTGNNRDMRKAAYLHYHECPGEHVVPCYYGVATSRYKLVFLYQLGVRRWELYDRVKDPGETQNLYEDPSYQNVRQELAAELTALRKAAQDDADPETASAILRRFLVTLAERTVKLFQIGESAQ